MLAIPERLLGIGLLMSGATLLVSAPAASPQWRQRASQIPQPVSTRNSGE
jgi:hypothetical protein